MASTIPWTIREILEASGGELVVGEPEMSFRSVCIDSRTISREQLFVAIEGERHDGHGFVKGVVEKGVRGAVVSGKKAAMFDPEFFRRKGAALIAVGDTTRALGDLAACNRARAKLSVAAVTGSNGKTTTRKMMAAVFRKKFSILSTRRNFNNDIGLPLTLLELSPEHRWAVLELGANHPGEIDYLARICKPDIAVVTNVGPAHLEGFGSLEGVASAKGEILDSLGPEGVAVLNADDPRVAAMASRAPGETLFYGISKMARIRAVDVEHHPMFTRFVLQMPEESVGIEIKAPGEFMVANALAAAAAGFAAGVEAHDIKAALEDDFQPALGRMNILLTPAGVHVIDDCYNANPASMKAALKALASLREGGRGAFAVGDMLELGEHAAELHRQLGRMAAQAKVSRLCAAGEYAERIAEGARAQGMAPGDIFVGDKDGILEDLKQWMRPGDWVLVKGSRGMRMEAVVEGLVGQKAK